MNVGDARLWQSNGEFILVELRVAPRHGDPSHVRDEFDPGVPQQFDEGIQATVGMTNGEEGLRHVASSRNTREDATFVRCDMVGLVALDLVLGIVLRGAMYVALVVEVSGVDDDDRS